MEGDSIPNALSDISDAVVAQGRDLLPSAPTSFEKRSSTTELDYCYKNNCASNSLLADLTRPQIVDCLDCLNHASSICFKSSLSGLDVFPIFHGQPFLTLKTHFHCFQPVTFVLKSSASVSGSSAFFPRLGLSKSFLLDPWTLWLTSFLTTVSQPLTPSGAAAIVALCTFSASTGPLVPTISHRSSSSSTDYSANDFWSIRRYSALSDRNTSISASQSSRAEASTQKRTSLQ